MPDMTDHTPPPAQEAFPALPEPIGYISDPLRDPHAPWDLTPRFSAEQMHAYVLADRAARAAPAAERWLHKKSGGYYQRLTNASSERDPSRLMTVYRSETSGRVWVRSAEEFYDGRFEQITTAPKASHD